MSPPSLSYGAGGLPRDRADIARVFEILKAKGVTQLDTARSYPGSEKAIGRLGVASQFGITTKAAGWRPGVGKKDAILQSAKESLELLGLDKVHVYLLHSPDPTVPISETLEAIQELHLAGKFEKFGVSNFSAEQLQDLHDQAKSKEYVLPAIYQANYNLLSRSNETRLFPTIRSLGMSIQVYSPIAGGFLVKSPEDIIHPKQGGRWDPKGLLDGLYSNMYNKPELLEYLTRFQSLAQEAGLSQASLAYRWVRYHSVLQEEDTMIIGASSSEQLERTLVELEKGPLDVWVVDRLEEMNKAILGIALPDNYAGWSESQTKL